MPYKAVNLGRVRTYPLPNRHSRVALEKSADGNSYFTIHDAPRILPAKPAGAPARVGILWDASASRGESNHEREREALRRFFARRADPAQEPAPRQAARGCGGEHLAEPGRRAAEARRRLSL